MKRIGRVMFTPSQNKDEENISPVNKPSRLGPKTRPQARQVGT